MECVQAATELTRESLCVFLEPLTPAISCIVAAATTGDLAALPACAPLTMQAPPAQLAALLTEGTVLDNLFELGGLMLPCAFAHFYCLWDAVASMFEGDFFEQLRDAATIVGNQLLGLIMGVGACSGVQT